MLARLLVRILHLIHDVPIEFRARVSDFLRRLKSSFRFKKKALETYCPTSNTSSKPYKTPTGLLSSLPTRILGQSSSKGLPILQEPIPITSRMQQRTVK
jgi:hypothetical protein